MSEKQIVEAFMSFFQRNVLPSVTQNEEIMREWNHLSKIIGSQPIDYTQIDFYILLANRSNGPTNLIPPKNNSSPNSSHSGIIEGQNKYRRNQYLSPNDRPNLADRFQDKKHSQIGQITNKRKNLMNSLQIFQKLLTQNQQRLDLLTKREGNQQRKLTLNPNMPTNINTSANGLQIRRYER